MKQRVSKLSPTVRKVQGTRISKNIRIQPLPDAFINSFISLILSVKHLALVMQH